MTEPEWRLSLDPAPLLAFLDGRASNRSLRLFACGCCREVWHLLADQRSRKAVEAAEAFADGIIDANELNAIWKSAGEAANDASYRAHKSDLRPEETAAWERFGRSTSTTPLDMIDPPPQSNWVDSSSFFFRQVLLR